MKKRYFYISNAFEEKAKHERSIVGDSPAASGKVIRLCRAVRSAGGNAFILSLGRGRQNGSWKYFPAKVSRSKTAPIIYAAFFDAPIFTHLVSMVSLFFVLLKVSSRKSILIFYNILPYYLPALVYNFIFGRKCILDVEDGYRNDDISIKGRFNLYLFKISNILCTGGAMLASSALKSQTKFEHNFVCYGIAPTVTVNKDWSEDRLQILFGGSLLKDTGAELLLDALKLIQKHHAPLMSRFMFVITGFGEYSMKLSSVAAEYPGFVTFLGNVNADEYKTLLRKSHIGLCLKIPDLSMGATTFPSKVIELTAYGLLLITTKVSDVPKVFSKETALILDDVSAHGLVEAFALINNNRDYYYKMSLRCKNMISQQYSSDRVGSELLQFWDGNDV